MSKKEIYFIRHGESEYNEWRTRSFYNCSCLCVCDPMIYDPALSKKGKRQVEELRSTVQGLNGIASKVQLVVTSPLSRAIDTCLGAFFSTEDDDDTNTTTDNTATRLYGQRPLVCALPRERLDTSGDIGMPVSELQDKYLDRLNLSELIQTQQPEAWWYDQGDVPKEGARFIRRESKKRTKERVKEFCIWLNNRPETCIAVVGHSSYIKLLTKMSRKLNNCEIKRFDI